jgi:hypothetical protein
MRTILLSLLGTALAASACGGGAASSASTGHATTGGAGGVGGAGSTGGSTGTTGGTGGAPPCVRVAVVDSSTGAPLGGVNVAATDANLAVVQAKVAGADGKACLDMPSGGAVMALSQSADRPVIYLVVAPPPGVTVQLRGQTPDVGPGGTFAQYTAKLDVPSPAAWFVSTVTNCNIFPKGVQGAPTTVDVAFEGCTSAPEDLVFQVTDNAGALIAWSAMLDVPRQPGATVDLGHVGVDRTEFRDAVLTMTDVPPELDTVTLNVSGADGRRALSVFALPVAGAGTAHVPAIDGLPWLYGISASGQAAAGTGYDNRGTSLLKRSVPWLPSVSASATALTRADTPSVDIQDPAHPHLAWAWTAGQAGQWTNVVISAANGTSLWDLTAILPPDRTSLRWPDVPEALASTHRPAAAKISSYAVTSSRYDTVTSYADAVAGPVAPGEQLVTYFSHFEP